MTKLTSIGTYVRKPAVAGAFYPADPDELRQWVDGALADARPQAEELASRGILPKERWPKAVIVPHAGYVYSGTTAALAYALLARGRGTIRRAVVMGPTHRVGIRGVACTNATAFATPLGEMRIDREAERRALRDCPAMIVHDRTHAAEHAVEVHLPFLQRALGDIDIVPLNCGDTTPQEAADVIEALWGGDETVIVISSDLSHYHPEEVARAMDDDTISRIAAADGPLPLERRACGVFPVNGLLDVCRRRGVKPVTLGRCTSGDEGRVSLHDDPRVPMADPNQAVVGYASFGVWEKDGEASEGADETAEAAKPADNHAKIESDHNDGGLPSDPFDEYGLPTDFPADAGATLIAVARRALATQLGVDDIRIPDATPHAGETWLERDAATFVTLNKNGRLRGCIGTLTPYQALSRDVAEHAIDAAFHDPRFRPVRADEYGELTVEISVLGTPVRMDIGSKNELVHALVPGKDGLILSDGYHRATYLPQVWEQIPDPREFIANLLVKAGLPSNHWSENMVCERYRVLSFAEGE